ncbi:MAG: HAMP domain-containing sensor histidine kinase [Rhodoferax sp.]|nr:HAMP domain-containing sensor histidine kinase [Rhodoferax sp.]MDP3654165.1 HAMP domain-containing sensor histidine kinase [Rhodoferax sp.]
MTVRLKIALTIFLTGLLTAVGVLATVVFAFQRFEHEATYYRASAFLERVVARHSDMFAMQERFQDDFNGFLGNLVLFEPDTQLYLLDSQGTVIASSSETPLPKGFKVALQPVLEAVGPEPMPYVMGDDPERMDATAVIAARALRRTVIRNGLGVDGYLYVVSHKATLSQGGLAVLHSTFAKPTLFLILAVVALSTLLAAWVTAAVTRPLQQLTATVAAVTRQGLEDFSAAPGADAAPFGLAPTAAQDEFGQLSQGIRGMLATLHSQWSMLRRLDHFRREGVSNLSHDLRSPLTATAACLETLEGRWAGHTERSADRQLVEVALRNTRNAARLVQSLGDLAQLDEPEFKLKTEVMDVSELLDDVALRFTERAARQGVGIQACPSAADVSLADSASVPLAAVDVELFERALANLVDNALKVCPVGATVSLDAVRVGHEVQVTVSDTGPGIAPADLPHLFDRFYQSRHNVAPATGEGGKGLGLAIVKRIVELHDGRVQVDSAPGAGTRVTLTLPGMGF